MSNIPYSNVVGSLIYATMCTRLDIFYIVGMVSRYQENPGMMHWKTQRIISFVIKTKNCVWWVIQMPIGQVI
ncbi:hypothetical protein AAG906_000749 [Vitis piasezkii]